MVERFGVQTLFFRRVVAADAVGNMFHPNV